MENSLPYQWDESYSVLESTLLLVDVSTPDNAQLYVQMVARYPDKWVIPYGMELKGYALYLSKPVRSQGNAGLVGIFTNLHPPKLHVVASAPATTTTTTHTAVGNPLLMPIWEVLQESRSFALHFDADTDSNIPSFVIDGQTQQCYALERPTNWLRRFEGAFQNVGLSHSTLEKILKKAQYHCYPLSSMKWCLALLLWDGKSSPQTASLRCFQLQRWPDFALLPYKPQHIVISGCLSKKPMTVDAIAATIKQPHALVHNFLNACAATGLLLDEKEHTQPPPANITPIQTEVTTIQTQETPPAHPATGKGDLFAALLNKLRGGKTWVKPV